MTSDAQRLAYLRLYAQVDADAVGVAPPDTQGLPANEEIVVLARFMARSERFMPGDWNMDNQKRNLDIRLFIEFSIDEIRRHGRAWLDRVSVKRSDEPWFQEWDQLINTASDDELARLLLAADEETTRQRLSAPFPGMLSAEIVSRINRSGTPI